MGNREQIIELVNKFILIADELLSKGKIDTKTYEEITVKKLIFLNSLREKRD